VDAIAGDDRGEARPVAVVSGPAARNAGPVDEASAVTVLCRQLIAGVLISDLLIDRVCEMSGQTREQALDQLIGDVTRELDDQQLRTLQVELSGSCKTLQDPNRASYGALGSRVEEVLALAEQQAREIVSAARAAATEITASARAQQPGSAHDIP